MITKKELNEVTLSPTKKDYYQIWNELLDLASKISSRWTPANTNESDPGIVLLKALTAIADKLNYNIDKNTLEAFMPSATQEESMRKLTEMLGYSMKYYQAATCSVSFSFKETEEHSLSDYADGIWFPRFLNLTNEDEDINYVTLESFNLSSGQPTYKVKAIEGELVTCESDTDNVVSLKHLDDLNRYILPEAAVAENGIFICNVSNNQEEEMWERIDNLNDKFLGSRIFKFGFDSSIKLPYIQFPEDISHLINSGLKIQYIRTRGVDGNISSETISKFIIPAEWSELTSDNEEDAAIKELSSDNFNVKNITSAINGADPESIDQAYNNYKKVIGTFNTLVTCRDYMNKIYQLMDGENSNTPLVSNIIAADIRDDINKAITLCSFNDYGICYSNEALSDANGKLIDHCDLILYPFKTIYNKNEKREYINSFKLDTSNNDKIYSELSEIKSLAHNFKVPSSNDIVCIKNYLKLKAQIYTKKKVTINEGQEIIQNIKTNLYNKFNMRQLDFGEEIPYEHIYEAMLNADTRIRDIILDEPTLNTKILTGDNNEYDLVSLNDSDNMDKDLYNRLVLRNVLAGRIAAFSYYNNTLNDFRDKPYAGSLDHVDPNVEGAVKVDTADPNDSYYSVDYSSSDCVSDSNKYIHKLIAKFKPDCTNTKPLKLEENQVIQFSMPNLKTTITYPAYVNYYFIKNNKNSIQRWYPATLWSIYDYIKANKTNTNLTDFLNSVPVTKTTILSINKNTLPSDKTFIDWIREQEEKYGTIIKYKVNNVEQTTGYNEFNFEAAELCEVYVLDLTSDTLSIWSDFIKETLLLKGIYKNNGVDLKKTPGYLIDSSKISYSEITTINTNYADGNLKHFYIPIPHDTDEAEQYTMDGLGRNGGNPGISTKTAYQLQEGDYLFINYSDSSDAESDAKTVINKVYTTGTIIKPNFELADSEIYHNSHSYSKKDNFNFDAYNSQVPGMFTLGTNEQIEIQEIEKVELDGIANLYWTLNSDKADHTSSTFYFTEKYFDNNILKSKFGSIKNAYMLKEGEYLYYTDAKKNDLAYYGAGTWVVKNFGWGEDNLVRDNNNNITIEDVEENGISASIPWTTFNLSKQDNKNIFIIGTQSITLTEGDTLEFISKTTGLTDLAENNCIFDLNSDVLTDNWIEVGSAKYKFAENETSQLLPTTDIDNISWHARSRLDLSMNEGYPQTLHHGDSITVKFKNYIDDTDSTDPDIIIAPKYVKAANPSDTSDFIGVPLVLQPNRLVQSAVGEAIVSSGAEITAEGTTDTILRDFVLKVTQRDELITKTNNILQLNNYVNNNNYFTKYSFSGEPALNGHVYSVNKDDIYKFEIRNGDQNSEYYLCGKFTNWQTVDKYKLSITDKEQNNRLLSANTKFSIIKKSNSDYSTLVKDTDFLISASGVLESDTVVEAENNQADFNLQINIPTNTFGAVMFYWIYDQSLYNSDGSDKKIKAEAKIEAIDADEAATEHISLFNSNVKSSSINLNRGFNMIQIDPEVKQLKIYGTCGNIIFDNLRIITGINPALNYQAIGEPNALSQMLSDIAAIPEATKFYCTAPIMSDTAIDLNQSIESDNFLDNALSWYDVNNINNKFVISEIDADFLNTGLSIAKTSRV